MHSMIKKALSCACGVLMFYSVSSFAFAEQSVLQQLPQLFNGTEQTQTDWTQANKKVAEQGGWQYYAEEAGGHGAMDHSKHKAHAGHSSADMQMMDHSKHNTHAGHDSADMQIMDHSKHKAHAGHSSADMQIMDHSKHKTHTGHNAADRPAMDHSMHKAHQHEKQATPQPAAGDHHDHHH